MPYFGMLFHISSLVIEVSCLVREGENYKFYISLIVMTFYGYRTRERVIFFCSMLNFNKPYREL